VVNSIGIEKDYTCNRKHSAELSLLLNMTILAIETKTKPTPHAIDCAKTIPNNMLNSIQSFNADTLIF